MPRKKGRRQRSPAPNAAPDPAAVAKLGPIAELAPIRAQAEEDMRSLAGLIQITATLGGLLFGTMLAIGLGVALDELFSIRQAIPSWLMAIFALIGCVVGLAKGSQWGEAWPRRTVERASDRVWKELRRPELALLAVQYDLPGLIAGLSGSEDWWRLALLAPGSSLKAQLKQAADFFPCLEAIIDERPQLQLRWRFVLCAFSRWVDEVTAFISRWFCCACLIPFGAFLIVLPLLPVLLLPIGVTLRRRAALIALCDFFASPEHPAGKPIRLQDK